MFGVCYLFKPSSASSVFALNKGNINSGTLDAPPPHHHSIVLGSCLVMSKVWTLECGIVKSLHINAQYIHTLSQLQSTAAAALCVSTDLSNQCTNQKCTMLRGCVGVQRDLLFIYNKDAVVLGGDA